MMATSTLDALLTPASPQILLCSKVSANKVTIIGSGPIGAACLLAFVSQRVCSDFVLIDSDLSANINELLEIRNASVFMGSPSIVFSTDYEKSANSRVVIITVGQSFNYVPQKSFDMDVMKMNVNIYREVIPEILHHSPQCVLIIATRPVDIMSYAAWKISGISSNRIIGSGCNLLTFRFRCSIAERLGINVHNISGFIVGVIGQYCVPLWSSVTVCGIRLQDINPLIGSDEDPEEWTSIHKDLITKVPNVLKGNANSIAILTKCILNDAKKCFCVSTHIKGCRHAIDKDKDVFMSMPCIIGANGVIFIVKQVLNETEKHKLQESADELATAHSKIGIV